MARPQGRAAILLALTAVMVLRALVPVGYMLGPADADGHIVLRICSAQTHDSYLLLDTATGETTEIDHPGDVPAPEPLDDPGEGCPFALSAVSHLTAGLPVILPPGFQRPEHLLPTDDRGHDPHAARGPPPARAPPVLI